MFMALAFSGCATKKKINKSSTQTEIKDESTVSRNTQSTDNGINHSEFKTNEISNDNTIVSFDSISTIILKPDGTIQATGTKPRIIRNRIEKKQSEAVISIDTTKVQKTSEDISQQKETKIIQESTDKDIKTRPAFLSIVIFLGIVGLLCFVVYYGLKKFSPFG
jgi:hypothetical protein